MCDVNRTAAAANPIPPAAMIRCMWKKDRIPVFMVGRETNGCFLHTKEAGAVCHDPF